MQKGDKIQIVAVHNKDVPIGLLEKILKGDRAKISPLPFIYIRRYIMLFIYPAIFHKEIILIG